ncbi:RT_Bac_retron_I domain containing protein [Methylophilaceae bacterium]
MHTERFEKLRKAELEKLLDKRKASKVWRKVVKDQLRSLEIRDLYDHYDFNYNIEERVLSLRTEILSGSYKVSAPLIYRMEKKFGVCRHLVIPQPVDALLLQLLVESVSERILEKQPSNNAFYSRDKHNLKKPHDDIEYGVPFKEQWKKLQKKIYKFSEEKELLVVTDLSNYYDSIHLEELRKVFVSLVETNEVVVDLLFKIIENISWVPDYLPYSKRGLPTSNIEAIRLLAHSFLFELDSILKTRTKNSFARWMDDITVGVNDRKDAISILSALSDMLKSRGLALNLAKTNIYGPDEGRFHFQIDQNLYLDSVELISKDPANSKSIEKELKKKFKKLFEDQTPKSWDKVVKRYVTAFSRIKSHALLENLPELYIKYPFMRVNLLYYLDSLGYSMKASKALYKILDEIDIFDDLSLYQISNLLTFWRFPRSKGAKDLLSKFETRITSKGFDVKEPSGFYSILWFKAKYSSSDDLLQFLVKFKPLWLMNSFLRRQATICFARLLISGNKKCKDELSTQALSGVQGTVSVANQIEQFANLIKLDARLTMYLFPTKKQKNYPLSKFLVLCSVLNSEKLRSNEKIKKACLNQIDDPTYLEILKKDYLIF